MSFGSRIKVARENKQYSQQQLADLMNVTDGTISNYEKGVAFPRWDTIKTICDLLDVDPNYLFWDDLTEDIKNKILDENNLKKYKKLSIEDKQKVDTYIDDLLATSKYQNSISKLHESPNNNNVNPNEEGYEIAAFGAKGTKGTYKTSKREIQK